MNSRILTWRTGVLCIAAAGLIAAPAFSANRVRSTNSAAPSNGVYQIQVLDAAGNPVQHGVAIYSASGEMIKTAQPVNGIIELAGQAGQKFVISEGTTIYLNGGTAAGIVLPSDSATLVEAKFRAPELSAGDGGGQDVGGATCSAATVISSLPYTDNDSVGGGAADPDLFPCGNAQFWGGNAKWYSVTGTGNTMTAETCLSTNVADTTLSVFLGCGANACDNLECVGGGEDDCGPIGFSSRVVWPSVSGQNYLVAVQGFANGFVNYRLDVSSNATPVSGAQLCTGGCCTCLNEPYNCQVENSPTCAAMGGDYQGDGSGCCTSLGTLINASATITQPWINNTQPPAVATATVPAAVVTLAADVNARFDLTHTFVGDLDIDVSHGGLTEQVWQNRCGSWDNMHATADEEGTETFCTVIGAGPSDVVHYNQPVASLGNLGNFDCAPTAGDWTLTVADLFGGDQGTLTAAWFELEEGASPCVGGGGGDCDGKKVKICHIPQGNPDNAHVIEVGAPAKAPHFANHGDCDPPAGAEKGDACTCP